VWLDHRQRIACGFAPDFAFGPLVAVAIEAWALVALRAILTRRTILARPVVTRPLVTIVAGPLVPLGVPGPIIARAFIAGAIVAGTLIAPRAVTARLPIAPLAVAALAAIVAIAVLVARALVALTIIAWPFLALAVALWALFAAVFAGLPGLGGLAGFRRGRVCGFGLSLGAFVLKIDVEARGEMVAAEDFAGGSRRLHGAQQAEIVFGVLQVVLAEDPIAGRRGVSGELLVFLEDVLGVAADLRALGAVGVKRPIGVLSLGLAAAAAAAATSATATIPAALTLHTLEISHYLITVLVSLRPDPFGSACASLQRDRAPGPV
jgi:hypothetical protein